MSCHPASATSKAASSRGGGVWLRVGAAEHVLRADRRRQQRWLARHATDAADSGHKPLSRFLLMLTHTTSRTRTISQKTPKYTNFNGLHGQSPRKTPMVALFTLMRPHPNKACGWTNNDQQNAVLSFLFWTSWEVQKNIAVMSEQCFLRRCDIGQMCPWAAESQQS